MYYTVKDYENEFGNDDLPLGDDDNIDSSKVERAIDRACREANTYIRSSGMSTPLSAEDNAEALDEIKGYVLDMARYYVFDNSTSEESQKRYDSAIKFFDKVASGKTNLFKQESLSAVGTLFSMRVVI
ncbi:hypothetical protein JS84_06355 [Vibrio vulnificus]|uniref:phage protein Gp36 family protein n=2 Tax=Vibrionaceae TaxID=641 RepID=UPI00034ACA9D|nr:MULTISPECIES: phage protein Gp36 family protein [Vibrio]EHR5319620.1 DUF1320 family protein [Vibrio parahaemolyticus]EWS67201.1 hypothetical protein Y702_22080 [Vibrio vulnificus BAA87]KFK57439.1 hypothetical protein JS83_23910 [Vibrio vulnificus]KFK65383.1 hypothetical protein JS84_06355 [Vibrio vulnificus]KFK69561.1 hypothetical protein JS85_08480 [Vibrio vulnificus]